MYYKTKLIYLTPWGDKASTVSGCAANNREEAEQIIIDRFEETIKKIGMHDAVPLDFQVLSETKTPTSYHIAIDFLQNMKYN